MVGWGGGLGVIGVGMGFWVSMSLQIRSGVFDGLQLGDRDGIEFSRRGGGLEEYISLGTARLV